MDTIEFICQLASRKKALLHNRTAYNYRATANTLGRYYKARNLSELDLYSLTQDLVVDFEHYLLHERLVCRNTSSFYMRQLRAVYNEAVRRDLCDDAKPFEKVYTGIAPTIKRSAQPQVLKLLFTLRLERKPDLEFARDMFHFAFLGRGIAFVDLVKLRTADVKGNLLTYCRSKTDQLIVVEILPAMRQIIERWHVSGQKRLFPILPPEMLDDDYATALRRYNRHLERLSRLCHSDINLTSYCARHSWASEAYRLGVPIRTISACMGHTTEQTTRIYIRSLSADYLSDSLKPLNEAYK